MLVLVLNGSKSACDLYMSDGGKTVVRASWRYRFQVSGIQRGRQIEPRIRSNADESSSKDDKRREKDEQRRQEGERKK